MINSFIGSLNEMLLSVLNFLTAAMMSTARSPIVSIPLSVCFASNSRSQALVPAEQNSGYNDGIPHK